MSEFYGGAEVQEVAKPVETQEGAEEQEIAEPVDTNDTDNTGSEPESGKNDQDTAFAELRRAREEAEARAKEAEKELEEFRTYRGLLSQVSDSENPEVDIVAEHLGISPDELQDAMKEELELSEMEEERSKLKQEVEDLKLAQEMEKDLAAVQKIDQNVKSLEELGDHFFKCIGAGMSAEEAYHAAKYVGQKISSTPPAEIGRVNQSNVEKDFYTMDEIKSMSPTQVRKNYKKVRESMDKLTKKGD